MRNFLSVFFMKYKDRKLSFWMKGAMILLWIAGIPFGFLYNIQIDYFLTILLQIVGLIFALWNDLHHYNCFFEHAVIVLEGFLSVRLFIMAPIGYFSVFFLLIYAVGIIFILGIRNSLVYNLAVSSFLFYLFSAGKAAGAVGLYDENIILRFPYLYSCILLVSYITMYVIQKYWKQAEERHVMLEKRIHEEKDKLAEMSLNVIASMYNALSAKVPEIDRHCEKVGELARKIAMEMELDDNTCQDAYYAGLLHEVGVIGLPDEILRTEVLTDDQYEIYKTYVARGYRIIKELQIVDSVAEAVLYHRENYDGSGYMEGKRGEEIPVLSRILSVADYTDRHQRRQETPEQIVELLNSQKGHFFDPKCVKIVCRMLEKERPNSDEQKF